MKRDQTHSSGSRPVRRIRDIVRILLKYGFRDWLESIHLLPRGLGKLRLPRRKSGEGEAGDIQLRQAGNIRMAMEEMGPSFVKFGQLLSTRRDILPEIYIRELSRLQDSVNPVPEEEIRRVLERELPGEVELLEFDPVPEASASIAQVHRARIAGIGEVAVKVQRPGIARIIEEDIAILRWIATQVEHYVPALRLLQPVNLVREFARTLKRELDFVTEAQNIIRFSRNFRQSASIRIPRVYPEQSSSRVLIMEFMHGRKLSRLIQDPLALNERERIRIAREGSKAVVDQVFLHAFFHGDPHPGNILILPGGEICFLDFGMMGQISPVEMDKIHQAIIAVNSNDFERLADVILSLVGRRGEVDLDEFRNDLFEIVNQYISLPLEDIQIPLAIQEILHIITSHNLVVPSKYLLMSKSLVTIEAVARQLQPGFTLSGIMGMVVRKVLQQQFNPRRAQKAMIEITSDYASLAKDFPRETREILRMLRRGRLGIYFKVEGLEPAVRTVDQVGSRLVYGILLTAVMVSSAMVFSSGLPPLWMGMPIVGLAGFGIAGIMTMNYFLNLIRSYFRNRWK